MAGIDTSWFGDAVCFGVARKTGSTELHFGTGPEADSLGSIAAGKRLCAQCPVAVKCYEYAETLNIEFGTFGGMDEHERFKFRRDYGSVFKPRGRREFLRRLTVLQQSVERKSA